MKKQLIKIGIIMMILLPLSSGSILMAQTNHSVLGVRNAYYDNNNTLLTPETITNLDSLILYLKTNPLTSVELSTFSNDNGNADLDITLSDRRNQAVLDYLQSKGIEHSRILLHGYGKKQPATDNTHNLLNRRTEFRIISSENQNKVIYNSAEAANLNPKDKIDTDGDGIPDDEDACPTIPGPPEDHGCPLPPPPPIEMRDDVAYDDNHSLHHANHHANHHSENHAPNHQPGQQQNKPERQNPKPITEPLTAVPSVKNPTLAYHYPSDIKQGETKYIFVHVNINQPSVVCNELNTIINNFKPFTLKHDDTIIHSIVIKPYEYITVTIVDANNSFTIIDTYQTARQQIDTIYGNTWKFPVYSKMGFGKNTLIIKVQGENKSKKEPALSDWEVPIFVHINLVQVFPTTWNYLIYENRKALVCSIIIPLFAFFGKRYFDRKKKKKEEEKPIS